MEVLDEGTPVVQPDPVPPVVETPAPEPQAAAPAPEPQPVEPTWLTEQPVAEPPVPEYPQQYPQQAVPPQYPPQPAYQAPPLTGNIEALVENPDAYIDRIVEQRVKQMVGPLYNDFQQTKQQQMLTNESTTRSVVGQADQAIQKAYQTFNQDPAFKSNTRVQQRVENTLRSIKANAVERAKQGDYSDLYNLANMNEGHHQAALAAAKAIEGISSPGVGPLQIEGASVESARAPVSDTHVELSPEQQEIADRVGGDFASRLRDQLKATQAADDFEL